MPHIVLAGYLGCGNLGDDAVMLGFVDKFGSDCEYTVLSGDPDETYRNYNIQGAQRKNLRAEEDAIKSADLVVFPGGSIFQDATSVKSVLYYAHLIRVCKKHKKRVALVGQGVGPLTNFLAKSQAVSAFNSVDLLVVRDPASMHLLKTLGVKTKIHLGADSAFLLPSPVVEEDSVYSVGSMKSIAICPRPLKRKGIDEVALIGEFCRMLYQANFVPSLVEMDSKEDGELIDAISKQQGGRMPQLRKLGSPITVQQRMARMDGVVAMRLHGGILAATVGIAPLMVSYDPKVTAFSKQMDLGNGLPIEGLTPARLFEAFQAHMKDRDRLKVLVAKKREELGKQAMVNVDLARELIGNRSVKV